MKQYIFTTNKWGFDYVIAAENKQAAFNKLLNFLKENHKEEYEDWKDVDINDQTTFPKYYNLDEANINQVISIFKT